MKSEPYSKGFVVAYKKHNRIGIKKKKGESEIKRRKANCKSEAKTLLFFLLNFLFYVVVKPVNNVAVVSGEY